MSSTLSTLNINVETFDDCLYLLDGRLDCLIKCKRIINFMLFIEKTSQIKIFLINFVAPYM